MEVNWWEHSDTNDRKQGGKHTNTAGANDNGVDGKEIANGDGGGSDEIQAVYNTMSLLEDKLKAINMVCMIVLHISSPISEKKIC